MLYKKRPALRLTRGDGVAYTDYDDRTRDFSQPPVGRRDEAYAESLPSACRARPVRNLSSIGRSPGYLLNPLVCDCRANAAASKWTAEERSAAAKSRSPLKNSVSTLEGKRQRFGLGEQQQQQEEEQHSAMSAESTEDQLPSTI